MKKTKTNLDLSIEQVLTGRLAELHRYNNLLLGRLQEQLESNAYHTFKAAAKEVSEVTAKFIQDAERVREKGSTEFNKERCTVHLRDGTLEVLSTGYAPNLYSGFQASEWNLGGNQGKVRSRFSQEDGSGYRTASGFRYQVVVHEGQPNQ